jgi:hypothetical protein
LRIAPPEAPVTGYMFGKGVYFADMVSKSANYCYAPQSDNVGLMLLCKVACGNFNPKYQADYNAANLPPNTQRYKFLFLFFIFSVLKDWAKRLLLIIHT